MKPCTWTEDADGNWESGCGDLFGFMPDGPRQNGFRYCPYCGKALDEQPYQDDTP